MTSIRLPYVQEYQDRHGKVASLFSSARITIE